MKTMKKIFLLLLLCIPMCMTAKDKDDSKYLAGAVPEINGKIVFQQTFAVKGKNQQQIYDTMKAFATAMTKEEIQMKQTRFTYDDAASGTMLVRFEEWMEFKKKPLCWDRTRFNYILKIECSDEKCHMEISQISYYYEEDMEGNNGKTYKAEEWISDDSALNKSKTKLLWGSAKFRRKTVDRVSEIFNNARNAFETPVKQPQATELLPN